MNPKSSLAPRSEQNALILIRQDLLRLIFGTVPHDVGANSARLLDCASPLALSARRATQENRHASDFDAQITLSWVLPT